MSSNNKTNSLIKWLVIGVDFLLLNAVMYFFRLYHPQMMAWQWETRQLFFVVCNFALLLSEWHYHTIIQDRIVSSGEILKRSVQLTMVFTLVAYIILKAIDVHRAVGWLLIMQGTIVFVLVIISRLFERSVVKQYRKVGGNSRMVVLVGTDPELWKVCECLLGDPTMGYRVRGYYADEKNEDARVTWLGTIQDLIDNQDHPENLALGDEMYVSLSRRDGHTIRALSRLCDKTVTKFYFVPISVESIGLNFKREFINDIEVFTTHETPLEDPVNKAVKRLMDIVLSLVFLIPTAILFPIIYLIIKIQSPGPILFKQKRTGLDGKDFYCYKFRSMHVNADADRVQATKDDPRKYPFGNFMRKANIDELPQFLNVLQGRMSIVGPRPHMLAHTEQYSQLIDKYMVRHFVKPGVTGWAQVTGFRGETKELWQMEGRVKRDIWYIEHWSIWLDFRIIWLTAKSIFIHDKNAY